MNAVILIFSYTLFKLKQLKKLANQIRKKSKSLTFATQYLKKPRKTKKWPKQFHGMICFHSNCYQSHAFFIVYSGVLPV